MKNMEFLDKFGVPNSVYPAAKHLTFGCWIYLVPQYKPKDVLILGYAGGTVAGLIRLLYGDVPITAVDIEPCQNLYNVELIQTDAKEYVKTCKKYDCVIVDLAPNDSKDICDFVTTREFAEDVSKIADYLIVNTFNSVDMSAYNFLDLVAVIKLEPVGLANKIYYYRTTKIPNLKLYE